MTSKDSWSLGLNVETIYVVLEKILVVSYGIFK